MLFLHGRETWPVKNEKVGFIQGRDKGRAESLHTNLYKGSSSFYREKKICPYKSDCKTQMVIHGRGC